MSIVYAGKVLKSITLQMNTFRQAQTSNHFPIKCLVDQLEKEFIMRFEEVSQCCQGFFFYTWRGSAFILIQTAFFSACPFTTALNLFGTIKAFGLIEVEVVLGYEW